MSAFWSALLALFLDAFGKAATDWLTTWQTQQKANEAIANAAVSSAATETQQVITGVADARSQLTPASSAGDLAAQLRARAAGEGSGDSSGQGNQPAS
ncbi:hypothetical protein ACETRX_03730 [Labrys portucalensis]|uniref:Uncharacterized protein n=1 Tax=Labrys neptuniae TaxID=376174 RepID=A0ABV6Z9E4_9HYPH